MSPTSLVHKLSFKILKENVDKFAEDVPQNFNNFDAFSTIKDDFWQ